MKKLLYLLTMVAMVIGLAIPMAAPVSAAADVTINFQSDVGDVVYGPVYAFPPTSWGAAKSAVQAINNVTTLGMEWGSTWTLLYPKPGVDIPGVEWISTAASTESIAKDSWRWFPNTIDIPGTVVSGTVTVNADNGWWLVVNDTTVTNDENIWNGLHVVDITSYLVTGSNTVGFLTRNIAGLTIQNNPNGLTYKGEIVYTPCCTITKEADTEISKVGDNITYTITIENTGDVDLVTDNITDSLIGDITSFFPDSLTPGASDNQSFTYTVPTDADDPLVNIVTVSYYYYLGESTKYISNSANCTVNLVHPAIEVTKERDKNIANVGDNVTYTITIENTGDVDLILNSVTDNMTGNIKDIFSHFSDTLGIGASENTTYTYTIKDVDPDPLCNTVEAHYKVDDLPNDIFDSAMICVSLGTDYQPDNHIQTEGDGIYNTSGSGQTATQTVLNGTMAIYLINIQNDGIASDNFTVLGTAGGGGWTVNYFDAPSGGSDITSQITSSTWVTPTLIPGEITQIRLEVTPSGLPGGSTKDVFVTSTSNGASFKQDTVKAVTIVEVPPPPPPTPPPPGGVGFSPPLAFTTCPLTLTVNVLGNETTATMTMSGVLCQDCVALGPQGQTGWEADEGTQLTLANNKVPQLIKITLAASPPPPSNAAIVGHMYNVNAYVSKYNPTPSPITISPPSRIVLGYDPDELPDNTSATLIAYYDEELGKWVDLETAGYVAGGVEVPNSLTSQVNHFTTFAVLAKLAEAPSKFSTSNLIINPTQAQLNQEVIISVKVTNSGGTAGDYNVRLAIDDVTTAARQITLAPETSQTVSFTINPDAAGKHQVEVAGLTGDFEILGQSSTGFNWWLIGGVLILVLLSVLWLSLMRRRISS